MIRLSTLLMASGGAALGVVYASGARHVDPAVPYLVSFWLAACGLDAWNTARHRGMMRYERNPVVRAVLSRRGAGPAAALSAALGVEALLVSASPLIILREWDPSLLGLAALAAGAAHVTGYVQTRSFLRGRAGKRGDGLRPGASGARFPWRAPR